MVVGVDDGGQFEAGGGFFEDGKYSVWTLSVSSSGIGEGDELGWIGWVDDDGFLAGIIGDEVGVVVGRANPWSIVR